MTSSLHWALHALSLLGSQIQASTFSFDGVRLSSDFSAVVARYPHSTPQDRYVSLAPQDIHDHISAVEVPAPDEAGACASGLRRALTGGT